MIELNALRLDQLPADVQRLSLALDQSYYSLYFSVPSMQASLSGSASGTCAMNNVVNVMISPPPIVYQFCDHIITKPMRSCREWPLFRRW